MENAKMPRIINRLIQWLEAEGMSAEKIKDCINFITK